MRKIADLAPGDSFYEFRLDDQFAWDNWRALERAGGAPLNYFSLTSWIFDPGRVPEAIWIITGIYEGLGGARVCLMFDSISCTSDLVDFDRFFKYISEDNNGEIHILGEGS